MKNLLSLPEEELVCHQNSMWPFHQSSALSVFWIVYFWVWVLKHPRTCRSFETLRHGLQGQTPWEKCFSRGIWIRTMISKASSALLRGLNKPQGNVREWETWCFLTLSLCPQKQVWRETRALEAVVGKQLSVKQLSRSATWMREQVQMQCCSQGSYNPACRNSAG